MTGEQDKSKLRKEIDTILKSECKAQIACPYDFDCKNHPDCFAKELNQILPLILDEDEIRKQQQVEDTKYYAEMMKKATDKIGKEAKREERECIEEIGSWEVFEEYSEPVLVIRKSNWQALKGGKANAK